MAIIINEFEIIPESPSPAVAASPAQPAPPQARPRPEDVEQIFYHQRARLRRIHAD